MEEKKPTFEEIYAAYHDRIGRYLSRLVGETEAEDLTQETFVKVSQRLDTFRGDSRVLTWLYSIATHTALDRLKSPSFREKERSEPLIEGEEDGTRTGYNARGPALERQIIREEMNACIRSVIDRLTEPDRTVIVLGNLEGLKDKEMAAVLGLTLPATKIRLHRARERLRKELSSTCVFYRDEDNELACDLKTIGESPEALQSDQSFLPK